MHPKTAVVVLAAGNSIRMGSHKALLQFDVRYNFIQKIISVYTEAGIQKIVVVVNIDNADSIAATLHSSEFENLQIVLNEHPEWERFYSIKCGLAEVVEFENCFIHNCDNPFIGTDIIRKILGGFMDDAVTIPEFEGQRGHPVLISRNIIQAVLSHPANDCTFKSFLSAFNIQSISVDSKEILYNINTWGDFIKFC